MIHTPGKFGLELTLTQPAQNLVLIVSPVVFYLCFVYFTSLTT